MFWCHNCQINVQSIQSLKCQFCSCEAIEQITQQSHPGTFQPYVSSSQHQNQQQNQRNTQQMNTSSLSNPFGMNILNMFTQVMTGESPFGFRYIVRQPILRIVIFDMEEQQKVSVEPQKIDQLPKVQLQQECAICQQLQGNGLKLPCNHEFHEHCIKPWFQNANTCPCCRVAL